MESTSDDFDSLSDLESLEMEDKIKMFCADEETSRAHPLNTRIHNPYQYVYQSDSYTCVVAAKLCLQNFLAAHSKIMGYLTDNKKYTDNEDIQVIITKVLLFEALLQVVIINLRHQETMKLQGEISDETIQKFKDDTILQELEESKNFGTKEDLESHLTQISEKFVYIEKEILQNWLDGDSFICVPATY